MEDGYPWLDIIVEQLVDEVIVEGDAFFVNLACAIRHDARPGD